MADNYTIKKGDTLWKIAESLLGDGSKWKSLYIDGKPASGVDPKTIQPGSTVTTSASGTTGSDSATATGGQELNNIGGTPEVWKVGNTSYVVYTVPGTEDDPVYIAWEVPSTEDLQSFFGPDQQIKYNKQITQSAFDGMGVLDFGSTDELLNTSEDPFSTWTKDMDLLSQTQPWILDSDYQALVAMSILEGRELTQAELATTDWWQTHSAAERNWMVTLHGDPTTAQQQIADAELATKELLTQAGLGAEPPEAIVKFLAYKSVSGEWSNLQLQTQVKALSDPYASVEMNPDLAALVDENPLDSQNITEEDTVRSLLNTWLGPMFGSWSDDEVARIAGTFRNDPQAEQKFIESLKDQRVAVLPEYGDRELSYQSIANTWKQWWLGQWGQNPDETSDLWLDVLKNNDSAASGQLLREEGLNQGVLKVMQDFSKQTVSSGNSIRNPIG